MYCPSRSSQSWGLTHKYVHVGCMFNRRDFYDPFCKDEVKHDLEEKMKIEGKALKVLHLDVERRFKYLTIAISSVSTLTCCTLCVSILLHCYNLVSICKFLSRHTSTHALML